MKSITQVVENLLKPYIDSHDRAAEAIIAPVETDATSASDDYAVGKQLILNNVLYDVIAPITTGDALVVNTNIKASDNVSSDIEALTNKLNNEIVTRSELGAKNLLPYDIQKIKALNTAGTWNGNTYTPNNSSLNITLNTDGSITVDGTSASAATATLYIYGSASEANENIFKGMIASGCPSGGATNKYSLAIQGFSTTTPSGGNNYHDIGEGITVGNDNYVRVYVRIQNNTTVSNLTFKPMIRLASDPDATYQPYAKTNQELTAENQTLTNETYNVNDTAITEVASDDILPIYDTSATGKKKIAVSNFIGGLVSNPNLLDNPWFTVNQRGQSSYSTNGAYTVDRWRNWSTEGETVVVNSDHSITLNKSASDKTVNIIQVMEEDVGELLVGKTVTLSALLSDGTIKSVSGVVVKDNTFVLQVYLDNTTKFKLDFYRYSDIWNVRVISWAGGTSAAGSITIKAIKLELGSVSTLAQDTAPNYSEELLKCQRYFYKYDGSTEPFSAYINEITSVRTSFPLPVPMRATPNLTFNYTSPYGQCGIYIPAGVSAITPTNITVPSGQDVKKPSVLLESTISSDSRVVAQTSCCQRFNTSMSFSADL